MYPVARHAEHRAKIGRRRLRNGQDPSCSAKAPEVEPVRKSPVWTHACNYGWFEHGYQVIRGHEGASRIVRPERMSWVRLVPQANAGPAYCSTIREGRDDPGNVLGSERRPPRVPDAPDSGRFLLTACLKHAQPLATPFRLGRKQRVEDSPDISPDAPDRVTRSERGDVQADQSGDGADRAIRLSDQRMPRVATPLPIPADGLWSSRWPVREVSVPEI